MLKIKLKTIKNFILIITLNSSFAFFALINLFGIKYYGKSDSNMYILFCILFAMISLLVIFFNWVRHKFKFNRYQLLFLVIPLFITLLFIKDYSGNVQLFKTFWIYLIFSVIASYIGIYYSRNNFEYIESLKSWMLLMWILSIGTMKVLFSYLWMGHTNIEDIPGTCPNQSLSYSVALAYSLNLFFILFKNKIKLFSFCYSPIYTLMSIILLFLQIYTVFLSGGRGGFVAIVFSSVVLLFYGIKLSVISKKSILHLSIIVVFIALIVMPFLSKSELLSKGIDRVFSYISTEGIDMTQTSYRDIVYDVAISGIKEKPLLGHGIFKQQDYMGYWGYPHNFFLEILLSGGMIYFLLVLIVSYFFYKKMIYLIKTDISYVLLLSIFSLIFTNLMFSGTYIESPLFWFLGVFVLSCNSNNKFE